MEVRVGSGVGESSEGVVETEGVNGCQVGEDVGNKVRVGVEVEIEVEVAAVFPSAKESEKPPRSKPIETKAMRIPVITCRKIFMAGSLQPALLLPASEH